MDFEQRDLLVLALGGNALSPPQGVADGYLAERSIAAQTGKVLDELIAEGYRLLVVHGNGPQVGRLLGQDPDYGNLDIHVAQTQGELGYLLAAATREPFVCVLTRVVVESGDTRAVKPIGPWLTAPPAQGAPAAHSDAGWRLLVPSPKPRHIVERKVIAELITGVHVIAGGGGGIPLDAGGAAVTGVVDKDYVASQLAVELNAQALVFATDVDGVYANFGQPDQQSISRLECDEVAGMIARGDVAAGSMAPKLESAMAFTVSTGCASRICKLQQIRQALAGEAGTLIVR